MAVLEGVRFIKEIEEGLKAPHRNLAEHPLIEKINRRALTRSQLKGLMVQLTLQTTDIVRWLGSLYATCPYPEVRRKVFLNLLEEELGAFSNSKAHFELCADCARALGATDEELATARPLPGTYRMILHGEVHLRNRPWVVGFGSAMGFEYQSPVAFKRIAAGLREHYGLDDDGVRFFDVHVTADEDHSEGIVETLIQYATTEELQRGARDAAWACAEAYHGMLSTYEAFE
jgi:pyrroloquinoline quinone (PQQ) biosynthesis protein C